jgi:predicted phosphoribosyltransferase
MPAQLIEHAPFRNRSQLFEDRRDAGRFLTDMLAEELGHIQKGIVLAIPSGGIPVAKETAERLELPLDVCIVRKIQIPGNTEAGFGAMTLDGDAFYNEELLARLRLSDEDVRRQQAKVVQELQERDRLYRAGRPQPDLDGADVVLVDDGLASGYTMLAACDWARSRGARRIVVAAPTAPRSTILKLSDKADLLVVAHVQDAGSFAVASAYRNWRDIPAEESARMLAEAAGS